MEDGQEMKGVVKNITDYGVFVDLGGIDGLLHITDMSWGRVGHPSEMCGIGDEINVKVLHFDKDRETGEPGPEAAQGRPVAQRQRKISPGHQGFKGKVVSLAEYGAFVEVEEGVEGLIHVSEMSWTRKVRHPSKIVSVGDVVEAVVLSINPEAKRISLGMKQVEPNPWDVIAEKYPVGTTIEGRIKNVTDFGLFIGIDEGIDGLGAHKRHFLDQTHQTPQRDIQKRRRSPGGGSKHRPGERTFQPGHQSNWKPIPGTRFPTSTRWAVR